MPDLPGQLNSSNLNRNSANRRSLTRLFSRNSSAAADKNKDYKVGPCGVLSSHPFAKRSRIASLLSADGELAAAAETEAALALAEVDEDAFEAVAGAKGGFFLAVVAGVTVRASMLPLPLMRLKPTHDTITFNFT